MNNKSKIKEIKVTNKNSEFIRLQTSFNKRWNIEEKKENKNQLKNRCLAVICNSLNSISEYYSRKPTIDKFCRDIEVLLGIPSSNNNWDNLNSTKLFKYIDSLDINKDEDYNIFMYFLELALNHFYYGEYVNTNMLAKELAEALKLSNANVIICKNGDNYELYPMDVELLSNKLVVDVLSWLNEYPNTKASFSKALKIKKTPDKYRNIIDELRLSIEFLF